MAETTLRVDGVAYDGWERIRAMVSMETVADQFELGVTDRWDDSAQRRPIAAGAPCELWLGSQRLLTGYVDDTTPDYDDLMHSTNVAGRSKAGDLVDCAVTGSLDYSGQTLMQVAEMLAKPLGIGVHSETDTGGKFLQQRFDPGASRWQVLEHLARIRAVRWVSRPDGDIVAVRAGTGKTPTALELGVNIERAAGQFTSRDRFSDYIVLAQMSNSFGNLSVTDSSTPHASAKDSTVPRYRPGVFLAESTANIAECKTRAEWQRAAAYGKSKGIVYTVSSWVDGNGNLWQPNTEIPVRDPWMGIDKDLLIVSVQFLLDKQGQRAEIRVMPREAFELVPIPENQFGF